MTAPQSTFVTVIAWLMIVFSGLSAFVGVLQSVFVAVGTAVPPISEHDLGLIPPAMQLIFQNFNLIVFANTAFSVLALVAAIGLLKRREWARRTVIGIFVLTAVAFVVIAVAQQVMIQGMFADPEMPPEAKTAYLVFRIGAFVFAAVLVAVHTWIAIRLNSAATRAEFQP